MPFITTLTPYTTHPKIYKSNKRQEKNLPQKLDKTIKNINLNSMEKLETKT